MDLNIVLIQGIVIGLLSLRVLSLSDMQESRVDNIPAEFHCTTINDKTIVCTK